MNKKFYILLGSVIYCLLAVQQLKSQSLIRGMVRDKDENILPLANIRLLTSKDSSVVGNTVSDSSGKYEFVNIYRGNYLVTVSFSGMTRAYSPEIKITDGVQEINAGIIYLENGGKILENVTVTGKKPMFEQKIDRMVINVKNSISDAGGSALDILEKSPGVSVNRQNNSISVNGKSGVVVMINGKITYLPSDAILQLLSATRAGNISRIELITTPPSKYDAEGGGGFINIVLLSNPNEGFSGSYFVTGGYGEKLLAGASANFNYRNTKWNLSGNYSFDFNQLFQPGTALTRFVKDGDIISDQSFTNRYAVTRVKNVRLGVDYQADTANLIGVILGGYDSRWTMTAYNGVTTWKNDYPDTTVYSLNDELNDWKNFMSNIHFQHRFPRGNLVNFDANYMFYQDENPNNYLNTYYDQEMKFLRREELKSDKFTPIHFWVFSGDYASNSNAAARVSWEAGAKLSLSSFTNKVSLAKSNGGIWVIDDGFSSTYLLEENIKAAYASLNVNLNNGLSLKAGLRFEYTFSTLQRKESDYIQQQKYGDLFPTFYLSQKCGVNQNISLSYSRRITRPGFNDLAPFTIFFDPKTFYNGNPALRPAIADAVQVNYGFRDLSISLIYTHESNAIDNFYFQPQKVDTINNLVFLSPRNFDLVQYFTINLSLPVRLAAWWTVQNNINVDWRQINTITFGQPVKLRHANFSFGSVQRFLLPNDISLELSGYFSTAGFLGTTMRRPVFQIDGGVQKKLNNNGDLLRFSANDIFNSGSYYRFVDYIPVSNILLQRNFNFGLASFKLTYTHHFGNKALKVEKERSTGAEEELNRVHN